MIEVLALQDGFYGGVLRKKDTTFMVDSFDEAGWFVPVERTQFEPPSEELTEPKVKSNSRKK
ncbi:hypothetical protein [Basilea psittacipulmonis]|uniref:Uncharacterized protein n=1 Tax=Basilea psittacipulmonis DSM 24701 TaxID=1072685 RepID=A0A077DIX1_9BURK|nr:hypothetical protein [Basilea psittacipulmonis]AIL33098.1 hypothetical protein IX83_07075 [Basilea psittacipulmonis DSM 24701]